MSDSPKNTVFALNLRYQMRYHSVKKYLLAEELDVDLKTVCSWVSLVAPVIPDKHMIERIAKYFLINADWFLQKREVDLTFKPPWSTEINWKPTQHKIKRRCLKCNKKITSKEITQRLCKWCRFANKTLLEGENREKKPKHSGDSRNECKRSGSEHDVVGKLKDGSNVIYNARKRKA